MYATFSQQAANGRLQRQGIWCFTRNDKGGVIALSTSRSKKQLEPPLLNGNGNFEGNSLGVNKNNF